MSLPGGTGLLGKRGRQIHPFRRWWWGGVSRAMNCPTAISLSLQECAELNISFHLLLGYAKDVLPTFVVEHGVGGLVTDFSPLRLPRQWVEDVRERLPEDVPFAQVGASTLGMEHSGWWDVGQTCLLCLAHWSDLSREHVCHVIKTVCFSHPSPRLCFPG